jgi:regulator of sigma E protease
MLSLVSAILVLGVLIVVHEFGHFLAAKLNGVGVERFSIGFGPRLLTRKVGETEYALSLFPLGGYVKMVGENPQEEEGEPRIEAPNSFQTKPVWRRALIVGSGPVANLLLAILIFAAVFMVGVPVLQPVVGQLQDGYPASAAGLRSGDRITAIDGRPISTWDDLSGIIHDSAGKSLSFGISRDGETLTIAVTPRTTTVKNLFGEDTSVGLVGISPAGETVTRRFPPWTALALGVDRTLEIIRLTFVGLGKIIRRTVPADSIGGPLMIVQMAGEQAKVGFMSLVFLVAFLSINLGIFNLLPIPILDGGHILFFLIEAARGKPLSLRKREVVQQIGLAILISIFLFASYNDVMRWASKVFAQ